MTVNRFPIALLFLGLASNSAHAELNDRGNGLIYDSTLNITWLADMKYALTSGYEQTSGIPYDGSNDGAISWSAAVAWAENLEFGGFSDWRLPTLLENDPTCDGAFDSDLTRTSQGGSSRYGCVGGELSHLFVVSLGNKAGQSVHNQAGDSASQLANYALFRNIGQGTYWSGTQRSDGLNAAWAFSTVNGSQINNSNKASSHYPLAVRVGDVTAVPEPTILNLFAGGLVILLISRHSRIRSKS